MTKFLFDEARQTLAVAQVRRLRAERLEVVTHQLVQRAGRASSISLGACCGPLRGQPILAKIKELTPKPITLLINTHTHGDHVSGNVEFPASVDVVVQDNTKTNINRQRGEDIGHTNGSLTSAWRPSIVSCLNATSSKGRLT